MDLPIRRLLRPRDLPHAIELLRQHPEARPVAGGTDLVVQLRDGRQHADVVIDLGPLRMKGIVDDGQQVEIAAGTTMNVIAADPSVLAVAPSLAEAAGLVGAWPIQCRATLGGNLANASPAADTAPPLLATEATVRLLGTDGSRDVPIRQLFTGPGTTSLAPGELLTAILLSKQPVPSGHRRVERFFKVGPRREQIIAVISLAGRATVTPDGRLEDVRIALGATAPTPIRAPQTEALLNGATPDDATVAAAARTIQEDIRPISDQRAPARYRRLAAATLVARFLESTRA